MAFTLKKAREKAGLTISEMSYELRLSVAFLRKVENGERNFSVPNTRKVIKLFKKFGINLTLEDIYGK